MGLELNYTSGQSPISDEEKESLLIKTISTRGELDEFEQQNIESAVEWSLKQIYTEDRILTVEFIKEVHRRMFSQVWEWAGYFRKTNKNFGVDKTKISQQIVILIDDCKYWIKNKTFTPDETAIRFKHRLVCIHPFPNGNGRHSRLLADMLISNVFKRDVFSWGGANLTKADDLRKSYIKAIHEADKGDIKPLINFARL